jgi:hypothetical protein
MNENNIKEFSDFVSNLNFTYTHSGGIDLLDDTKFIAQRMVDFGIYDIEGYASVKHFCNNLSLPEFEKRLKVYTRNIDDAVTENIKDLPNIISSISNLKNQIFNFEDKYDGKIIYIAPEMKVGKGHLETIESGCVSKEEIIGFYQLEVYAELKLLIGKSENFSINHVKINYSIDYTEEKYIQCIKYFLDSLLNSLENKKYMYTSTPQNPIISNTEKIKWNKNQNALAYLISNLHEAKYIKLPSNGDEIQYSKAVELILNTFSFNKEKVNIDRFTREFNLKSNTYKIKRNDPLLKLLEILDKISD